MSYYGGTITVDGRALITSLIAGETIEFTRVMVGSGKLPDGVEPIDVKELFNPVAEATTSIPTVENGVLYMNVEYRNDMNGGLKKGFWISEFGIYARTNEKEEILLYYATLGDSPLPVNALVNNMVEVRRFPVTIALELDSSEIQIAYNPGAFVTAAEVHQLVTSTVIQEVTSATENIGGIVITPITIPQSAWMQIEESEGQSEKDAFALSLGYGYTAEVELNLAHADQYPNVALDIESLKTAQQVFLCPTIEAEEGFVRFWAQEQPQADMKGVLSLLSSSAVESTGSTASRYVLPAATSTTLGGVKVANGSGLKMDGPYIGIDFATDEELMS